MEEIPLLSVSQHKKLCKQCDTLGVVKYTCFISGIKTQDKITQVERVDTVKTEKVKIANRFSDKQNQICQTELTYTEVTEPRKKYNKGTQTDIFLQPNYTLSYPWKKYNKGTQTDISLQPYFTLF